MLFLVIATLALLAGCATNTALSGYCTVYPVLGGKSEPMGLVLLPQQLEASLRSQLPAGERSKYICWYASGNRIIAGDRRDLDLSNLGYVFVKRGDSWVLSDPQPIILALPRAIQ